MAIAIIALSNFEKHNGATRVIPGSHKNFDNTQILERDKLSYNKKEVQLIGKAGSIFVLNGNILHAGGQNNSDKIRHSILLTFWQKVLTNGKKNVSSCNK